MRIDKKIVSMLFALTLLITSLLLVSMNGPTSAQISEEPIYLHGPSLTPIHLNSNKTLTPVHMHSKEGLIDLYWPWETQWHELHPNYCQNWTLTSWNDTGDPTFELSPNDQIDMTDADGNVTWYHVDRITITLLLSGPFLGPVFDTAEPTMAIELKLPFYDPAILYDPMFFMYTLWHEVWPNYSNVYNLTSHNDNLFDPGNQPGVLDICDSIDLTNMTDQTVTWWHVEDVATDLILREKITDPRCTWWHEIYPEYCNWYHLTSWEDNQLMEEPGYGMLSPFDQIDMAEKQSGNTTWYHVDRVTVTLNVTDNPEYPTRWMKIEFKTFNLTTPPYFEEMYEVFKYPWSSLWHEVYPDYCNVYNLTEWDWYEDDNCNGVLDPCDWIWLLNITSGDPTTDPERWHVEDMTYDLILNKKISDPVCTDWHELYPEYCNWYHIDDWMDTQPDGAPGNGLLSPCDNVTMNQEEYHVENVTLTLTLIENGTQEPPIYIESMLPFEEMYLPKTKPSGTPWHEVYPTFCTIYILTDWLDNCNGVLDLCDFVELTPEGSMTGIWYHIEEVAVDIVVKKTGPPPPPPELILYWKENYTEYAPSGVPDFDQNQGQWGLRYCAPTAVANSLWWMDSRFHPSTLLTAYPGALGEHDPSNVQPFIQHLAWLMDTDGQRTLDGHLGTWTLDMETGIAHYLSWSGVNPLGDVNGDGTVDNTDYNIVVAANNTTPLSVTWDMAADIWPETVTGPYTADNVVNQTDIDLVTAHMGETGQFHEWTILHAPDFYEIEYEVEECEDVILILGFWHYDPQSGWIRQDYPYEEGSGHAVTVAGINSTSAPPLIAISDPDNDAFESGLTPGRSPVPHAHNPPGNTTTHNNASLVSHDIYNVTFGAYPTGTWALQGYVGAPPGYIAVVESAVITSPLVEEVVDVAVTNVVPSVSEAYPLWTIQVNVTVLNNGTAPITCPVTAYYNASTWNVIGTQNVVDLGAGANTTLTFNWNLAGVPICNRRLKANATLVGDVNLANNEFVDGSVKVKKTGDVNNDGSVSGADIVNVLINLGTVPPKPIQCDINGDGSVSGADIVLTLINLGGYVCT